MYMCKDKVFNSYNFGNGISSCYCKNKKNK